MDWNAYHFAGERLRNGDPVPPDGATLRWDGPLVLCESGLHASPKVWQALYYAPGATLCRVHCAGEIVRDDDKLVCRERTIIARIDATELLREYARACARDVLHLWDAPDVVRRYLETGDEAIRDEARVAARYAAWDAAQDAARYAAWDAAQDAARYAAWDAARDAAQDAARYAAWAAAQDAARYAARYAAQDAAQDAARVAAWDAAWDAAWAAAWAAARYAAERRQRARLTRMANEAFGDREERVGA